MEPVCPIDSKCFDQISTLLKPPSHVQVQKYFEKLIANRQCQGLRVSPSGDYGKGVYADMDFKEGDLVLKDPVLFGIQHSSNKMECLVCSHCFQFIGSIELQIGRKLFLQNFGDFQKNGYGDIASPSGLKDCEDHGDGIDAELDEQEMEQCGTNGSKGVSLPNDVVESLMNGAIQLPYSDQFQLPPVVSCPGGCKEAFYCSKFCSEADWKLCHSLLCTGKGTKSLNTQAPLKFIKHANETNDIFLLAAKVISFTILRYRKLKAACLEGKEKYDGSNLLDSYHFPVLIEAWEPVSMGYKRRWWDCISLPDDVDNSDEAAFRSQVKELAFSSLQLLKEAIFDPECEPLFSLEIYGHIIGMFEQNNLDLVVESPVENYFLYIDDLPHPEKEKAEQITQPFLDALGEDYSSCCQGTAFYPLQSCMNHSCSPNAKAFKREMDTDGQATLIALKPIQKGQEITISYIDEECSYEERQKLLADYGFRCRCPKCIQEER